MFCVFVIKGWKLWSFDKIGMFRVFDIDIRKWQRFDFVGAALFTEKNTPIQNLLFCFDQSVLKWKLNRIILMTV